MRCDDDGSKTSVGILITRDQSRDCQLTLTQFDTCTRLRIPPRPSLAQSRHQQFSFMAAIYSVYTSPTHPPIPNHLPTLIVTPHGDVPSIYPASFFTFISCLLGQPSNILYSYLHTNFVRFPTSSYPVSRLMPPFLERGKLPFNSLSPRRPLRRQAFPTTCQ